MDALRKYLEQPAITGVVGFVIGAIVGLVVLGWTLFPVTYTDAFPEHLRVDFREDYLRMAIDSYSVNLNAQKARQRFQGLGVDAQNLLTAVQIAPNEQGVAAISQFGLAVGGEGAPEVSQPGDTPSEEQPAVDEGGGINPLITMCGLTVVFAAVLAGVFYFRRQETRVQTSPEVAAPTVVGEPSAAAGEDPPLAQFMTTYMLGDDLFDDSFSVDSPAGEFLGECGIGIAETIGVGEPKRVSSFEVWLFDKNDIQTVTKVLMSSHVFNDEATRQRLAAKGEPVLAEPGNQIVLETATLQLLARVVDMSYGEGALPPESFFERLTLDLAVWPKSQAEL